MTGSGRNASSAAILIGTPLAQTDNGNVIPAGPAEAFAVATSGATPGLLAEYTTDGFITRTNWGLLAGTQVLTPGYSYFLADGGRLSTAGQQQVGVAVTPTQLRVSLLPAVQTFTKLIPVSGPPSIQIGNVGDVAYDAALGIIYGPKTNLGWRTKNRLVTVSEYATDYPISAVQTPTGWQICS